MRQHATSLQGPIRSGLAALVYVALLTGCPAALFAGGAIGPNATEGHPPNAGDYASWSDVPNVQLETHSQFVSLPREVRSISDGSEMWIYRQCPTAAKVSASNCCLFQFVIRDAKVAQYRTAGTCAVNCSMRPDAKVQACINAAIVPDGYR
ncbi:MAG: hypothetical protein JWO86_7725 [Myxococcaceae bacterium]|nr:hypothetical protein [Myxococcaceae bacterium]